MSETVDERAEVLPFWGRVSIQPLDEQEATPMSILLTARVSRGVVLAVDDLVFASAKDLIPPGTVVYYYGGYNIGGTIVIAAHDIIAFES